MKFLLDTNFLMVPGQFKVDIYGQLRSAPFRVELYTIDLVVDELKRLASGRGRHASNARLAIRLLEREGVKVLPSGKPDSADEAIRRIARREGMVVCTADRRLKEELKRRKIPTLSLRKKKYLDMADFEG
jgi:rRNA-processing protein FCF1